MERNILIYNDYDSGFDNNDSSVIIKVYRYNKYHKSGCLIYIIFLLAEDTVFIVYCYLHLLDLDLAVLYTNMVDLHTDFSRELH